MSASETVIEVHQLTKSFGRFRALKGVDLEVEKGGVHGFLGPNGAGKSTTIRVLLGLLKADGGTVRVLGGDPWRDVVELHRRLAYVPGDVSLWPGMTGGEAIDLLGTLRGGLNEARRKDLLERFELDPSNVFTAGVFFIDAFASSVRECGALQVEILIVRGNTGIAYFHKI